MGSPEELNPRGIRRFLRSFLSDRRVVNLPRALWYPILYGMVLPFRPYRLLREYGRVWLSGNEGGSALTVYTRRQAQLMQDQLPEVEVRWAMSYSAPRISEVLAQMQAELPGGEISILPLYPHYAPATVAAVSDQVAAAFERLKVVGEDGKVPVKWRLIESYPTAPALIDWQVKQIVQEVTCRQPDLLLFSYHGLPDTPGHGAKEYSSQCSETTAAIMCGLRAHGLEIAHEQSFQSKFGLGKWLGPATIERVAALPALGVNDLLVVAPGFLTDCLETVSELGQLNREVFSAAGGKRFRLLPGLNDHPAAGEVLAEVYRERTDGCG